MSSKKSVIEVMTVLNSLIAACVKFSGHKNFRNSHPVPGDFNSSRASNRLGYRRTSSEQMRSSNHFLFFNKIRHFRMQLDSKVPEHFETFSQSLHNLAFCTSKQQKIQRLKNIFTKWSAKLYKSSLEV